uniref:Tc1-like transposase DDE domain-containing protein n=1 Tax=Globisporangium ultimum (strain ATCC 200006 / CBS 805.95 / DAOM BR144) TaxID=431595 RepID=K3W6I7_GLOUD
MDPSKCVLLRLGPYSSTLNSIEGYFSVLKAHMKTYLSGGREEFLVRGEFSFLAARRMHILKEAATTCKDATTEQVVMALEFHCAHACVTGKRGDNMVLGQ